MSEETNKAPPHDRLLADVRRLTHLIANDGEKLTFGSTMKVVYAYLVTFQGNPKRLNYPDPIHPNMELIAWECGITKPTAQKAINNLVAAGVVVKTQISLGSGFDSNAYVILQQAAVFKRGVTPPKPGKEKISKQAGKKTDEVKPRAQQKEQQDVDPPFPPEKPALDDIPEGFTRSGEAVDGAQIAGEPLGYDEIHEKAGAG